MAEIHPQLLRDCLVVGRFSLCHLLLMRDANYPWFILVPNREGVSELFQLSDPDQIELARESARLAAALAERFQAHKMNVAALGNLVPQLHIHHIVRYRDDAAWPAPVWGKVQPRAYSGEALAAMIGKLKGAPLEGFEWQV